MSDNSRRAGRGVETVAHHHRLLGPGARQIERVLEDRGMRLAPADAVRARDGVDRVREAEAPPVLPDLGVPARQRVRDQRDTEPVRLAPAKRLRSAGCQGAHEVERDADERADAVEVDVVDPDRGVLEPVLVPAQGLLSQLIVAVGPSKDLGVLRLDVRVEEALVPIPGAVLAHERIPHETADLVARGPPLDKGVPHVEEDGAYGHAPSIRTRMLDFEQLAFIEKWRQRAARGVIVALDGTHGDILVTMRVGEGADRVDLRGRDATGAVRKGRLTIGDRVTMAIEYAARDVGRAAGRGVSGRLVAPGAKVEGTVASVGEIAIVDCGTQVLVAGETLGAASVGDEVAFTIADEGKAYLIPTR